MKRKRIIEEERYVRIYCQAQHGYDMDGRYDVPEKVFYDEPWRSDEEAKMLLELAKKTHKKHPHHTCAMEPIGIIYWKTISEELKEL
jgi:hypothetical protein